MSNDLIERFLRNNLDDDDYKEYSVALDELYTPKRLWVGLTDEEQQQAYEQWQNEGWGVFYRAIEAKLKEKNHELL